MKGKGKGERPEKVEIKDCPLQFPDLSYIDTARVCPRYHAVLHRGKEDTSVSVEELDWLQPELENLLAAAAKRMRLIEAELNILNSGEHKLAPTKSAEVKRSLQEALEDRPSKKFKESPGKVTPGRPKGKVQQVKDEILEGSPLSHAESEMPSSTKRVFKNDAPDRLWCLVEPYCSYITPEDIKFLEGLLATHDDDADYYRVPLLGKHYVQKWAQEDLMEEQKDDNKLDRKRNASGNSKSESVDVAALIKQLEENDYDDSSPFGPLTQRLVSALIEENVMGPLDGTGLDSESSEMASISPSSLAKQLNLNNCMNLERRIKHELQEQGLLDVDGVSEDGHDQTDEVLCELKRKQQELRTLSEHHVLTLRRLLKLAKDEMHRQELRHKVVAADSQVMDAFRKIQMAKLKKKQPTKKEKECAIKALRDREEIIKQLEACV